VVGLYDVSVCSWLVSYSLDLYCCLFVSRTVCLNHIVIWLFDAAPVLFLLLYVGIVGIGSPASLPPHPTGIPRVENAPYATTFDLTYEHDQRGWEEPDPSKMARGVYATEREPAWYRRIDGFHQGTPRVPSLSREGRTLKPHFGCFGGV
jgi:hypothetical protein